jgi:tRNA pseudouridine13 synthase
MLKGDFETAAMRFLAEPGSETNADARGARERLGKSYDFADALSYFPNHLKYERSLINYLAVHDSDWVGAIRSLPRQLALMFVHSVENAIFNAEVMDRIAPGSLRPKDDDLVCAHDNSRFFDIEKIVSGKENPDGIVLLNILGYATEHITEFEKEAMDVLGIEPADFKVRGIGELGCKGSLRAMMSPYKEFSATQDEGSLVARFCLPAGSYATVMLSQLVDYPGCELIYTFTEK